MRPHLLRLLVFTLLLIAALTVWLVRPSHDAPSNPSIVLISIDTCRADRLGCYGLTGNPTPNIDAVAQQGILFTHALAPNPLTRPSHATMLTGTNPPFHQVHGNGYAWLADDNTTLAEILREKGYDTAAFVSSFILDEQFGLAQGFDIYDADFTAEGQVDFYAERRADDTTRRACRWLNDHRSGPFFLFLHYYDPHYPYEPPEPFASRFSDDPYTAEIAYTDHCLAQVIDTLKQRDWYDSTLLIITSDHGESLGEHGENTHGFFIYQSVIHVPLIMKLPGKNVPAKINDVVGLVDIAPTILSSCGIKPPAELMGRDLRTYLWRSDGSGPQRYIYCESLLPLQYQGNPLLAVISDRWKYIAATRPELYDLPADPHEKNNLAPVYPDRVRTLHQQLDALLAQQKKTSAADTGRLLDEQNLARLESLGYVAGGSVETTFTIDPARDDPKDLIAFHQQKELIKSLLDEKKYDQAKLLCRQMLDEQSNQALGYRIMGQICFVTGDLTQAADNYRQCLLLAPDDYLTHNNLALVLYQLEKPDQALLHWRQAVKLEPNRELARKNLAHALFQLGQIDQAIEHWNELLQLTPDQPELHRFLGQALIARQEFDEALQHLNKAIELNPADFEARYQLGIVYYRQARFDDAVAQWNESLGIQPDQAGVLYSLAWLLATRPQADFYDPARALALAQKACSLSLDPPASLLDVLAAAYAANGNFDQALATAQKALELARATSQCNLVPKIENRLKLFQDRRPFVDTPAHPQP